MKFWSSLHTPIPFLIPAFYLLGSCCCFFSLLLILCVCVFFSPPHFLSFSPFLFSFPFSFCFPFPFLFSVFGLTLDLDSLRIRQLTFCLCTVWNQVPEPPKDAHQNAWWKFRKCGMCPVGLYPCSGRGKQVRIKNTRTYWCACKLLLIED